MVGHRRHDLVASRRRLEDEGEEEEGGAEAAAVLDDDSLSEASALSELEDDDDADAEGSDISEQDEPDHQDASAPSAKPRTNGHVEDVEKGGVEPANGHGDKRAAKRTAGDKTGAAGTDTEAMLNGLAVPEHTTEAQEVRFEDMADDGGDAHPAPAVSGTATAPAAELPYERRRREQEEYRKKRDADPTFVPNRGGFFMHDHRHAGPAANGFRPFGRGRGRGRGAVGGPFSPANQAAQSCEPVDAPWSHDLHESVAQPEGPSPRGPAAVSGSHSRALPFAPKNVPPNRSFSTSKHIGNVQVRVLLAGMKEAITFAGVPVTQHTRLPHHRPPLRRDKPVRVSLPNSPPRYIFPSVERSFIFIPRALRPNQQGYGRGGHRGGYTGHRGGLSSRRTSAYGGSNYSPSVAMSRRSSLAQEVSRDAIASPAGSTVSRQTEQGKPVVRLPPPAPVVRLPPTAPMNHGRPPQAPALMRQSGLPAVDQAPQQGYPPPQDPTFRENRVAPIPMHQPRPQKAVSVADIESPETVAYPRPQPQQQQPFHHQMPAPVNGHGQPYPQEPSYQQQQQPHSRNPSYPSQHSAGTPLSQIPERAIHAQPFQPYPYQQQAYYAQPYQAVLAATGPYYYHPAPGPPGAQYATAAAIMGPPGVGAPSFIPTAHQHQHQHQQQPQPQQQPPPQQHQHQRQQPPPPSYVLPVAPAAVVPPPAAQSGTVAQESNGMVYYYDSSQLPAGGSYPPPAGPAAGPPGVVVGIGGMMTPSPDGYYYPQPAPAAVYYGQQ
ncbi:MAG: hypothetical protein M1832_002595 [Thelocarpon impressellum]|nr:MAG: hypothetical protein M1832_002595 [Thelocarpon impressellum]